MTTQSVVGPVQWIELANWAPCIWFYFACIKRFFSYLIIFKIARYTCVYTAAWIVLLTFLFYVASAFCWGTLPQASYWRLVVESADWLLRPSIASLHYNGIIANRISVSRIVCWCIILPEKTKSLGTRGILWFHKLLVVITRKLDPSHCCVWPLVLVLRIWEFAYLVFFLFPAISLSVWVHFQLLELAEDWLLGRISSCLLLWHSELEFWIPVHVNSVKKCFILPSTTWLIENKRLSVHCVLWIGILLAFFIGTFLCVCCSSSYFEVTCRCLMKVALESTVGAWFILGIFSWSRVLTG